MLPLSHEPPLKKITALSGGARRYRLADRGRASGAAAARRRCRRGSQRDFVAAHPEFFRQPRTGLRNFRGQRRRRAGRPAAVAGAGLGAADAGAGDPCAGAADWTRFWLAACRCYRRLLIDAGRPIVNWIMEAAPGLRRPPAWPRPSRPSCSSTAPADRSRGRVVFVGANASGTFDVKPLPVGQVEPGVLDSLDRLGHRVSGSFIAARPAEMPRPPGRCRGVAARHQPHLARGAARRRRGRRGAVVRRQWLLLSAGWFLALATPLAATALVLRRRGGNLWREQRRKREIQAMFGGCRRPGRRCPARAHLEAIALRGERREATVFFSDLAGFCSTFWRNSLTSQHGLQLEL